MAYEPKGTNIFEIVYKLVLKLQAAREECYAKDWQSAGMNGVGPTQLIKYFILVVKIAA